MVIGNRAKNTKASVSPILLALLWWLQDGYHSSRHESVSKTERRGCVTVTFLLCIRKAKICQKLLETSTYTSLRPKLSQWPTLGSGEQESKYLAFPASIMQDAKEGGFENGSWANQPMASATCTLFNSLRSHQTSPRLSVLVFKTLLK